MRGKVVILIALPIFALIVGLVLNFPEFLMGSPATIKNFLVTLVYIAIWIFILSIASQNKKRKIMKYYSAFWLLTLFFVVLSVYVNSVDFVANWAIPFVGLLLPQWYGIELLVDNLLITNIIISSISLIMFIATLLALRLPTAHSEIPNQRNP